jgi:hypothetical protein
MTGKIRTYVPIKRVVTRLDDSNEYGLPGFLVRQAPQLLAEWYWVVRKDMVFKGTDIKTSTYEILGLDAGRGQTQVHDGQDCAAVRLLNLKKADFCENIRTRVAEILDEPLENIEFRGLL